MNETWEWAIVARSEEVPPLTVDYVSALLQRLIDEFNEDLPYGLFLAVLDSPEQVVD